MKSVRKVRVIMPMQDDEQGAEWEASKGAGGSSVWVNSAEACAVPQGRGYSAIASVLQVCCSLREQKNVSHEASLQMNPTLPPS